MNKKLYIISGVHKNRKIFSQRGPKTRPMMAKVRNAVFNIVYAYFGGFDSPLTDDTRWLDLYAGTGSVGLEALSRGVGNCHFVELDNQVVQGVLNKNIGLCDAWDSSTVHVTSAESFLQKAGELGGSFMGGAYDYISVCPPYEKVSYPEIFELLEKSKLIHERTLVVVEFPNQLKKEIPRSLSILSLTKFRKFGRTFLAVYGPEQVD